MDPGPPPSAEAWHADPAYVTARSHHLVAHSVHALDALPLGRVDIGPGSLALYLGSEPGFSDDTVWFHPLEDQSVLERPLQFDPANNCWQRQLALVDAALKRSAGRYPIGMPDIIENLDVLASLRDAQTLMMDLVERPEWVKAKIAEINRIYFEVYDTLYARIALPDGSACFHAFHLWGPGRTAKVQCDALAMISPAMFAEFVQPALTEQCDWLDHAMFHLDGTQAIAHLPGLLEIPGLDAIEYTPQAGLEGGGHERWWPLYQQILAAGKSVQVVGVRPDEVAPLLDAIGTAGVFLMVGDIENETVLGELEAEVRRRYPR
ncbi:MAG: hypothetical protein K9M98_02070 [Cephaloticoccus sp.]|nr:hypothetical protein [Cephaloticoccus sp.]MCF7759266.1 hypothetical protein [Cephaloticoccus sp.]